MRAIIWFVSLWIVGVLAAFAVWSLTLRAKKETAIPTKAPANAEPAICPPKVKSLIEQMEADGYLRVEAPSRAAYISPLVWLAFNAEYKQQVTYFIALYIDPSYPSVTLYDAQSARELASYGPFQGFVVR
ncbi:MAG: hypothetical protein WCE51_08240 [Chthoniobacterales bacterium]